jgi:predicted transcriptional regulator
MTDKKSPKKDLTVKKVKDKITVRQEVKDELKAYNKVKREIIKVLKSGEKTIPELVKETGLETEKLTYHVMSMAKFGDIEAGDVNDDDYYYYKLPKNQKK